MPERKSTERKNQEEKVEQEKPQGQNENGVSRRGFLLGAGAGVAGLAVGGVGGSQIFPKQTPKATISLPAVWVGRDLAACTGCRLCAVACSQTKENGKIWPAAARVVVHDYFAGGEFPVLCYQCGEQAKCIEKCPAGALSLDTRNTTIVVDTKKCLRTSKNGDCTICRDECPGTAVSFHPVSKAPLICDTCNGDPACSKVCPSGTLRKNGLKAAAMKPAEIAATLHKALEIPPAPPKAPSTGPAPSGELDHNPFA